MNETPKTPTPMTMVYRFPGPHALQDGGYDYITVPSDAVDAALADGWYATPVEARAAAEVATADDAPPTREELLAKAAEIGLTVDARWGDKRLTAEIEKALA